MRYVKPDFFDKFKCIADKCPDNCCEGWQIVIDEDALERYDEAGLSHYIDWQESAFKQRNGRCVFLNGQKLCKLVIDKGEEWLCNTCARYPRHEEEFEGVREWSLSLSCPMAASMMLERLEPMQFVIEEDDAIDPLEEEFEDFDLLLFTRLEDARTILFRIIQNREIPMVQRMAYVLRIGKDLQECIDEERLYDMEDVIEAFAGELPVIPVKEGEERFQHLKEGFEIFHKLERLRVEWTEILMTTEATLYSGDYEKYQEIYEAFHKAVQAGEEPLGELALMQEQLMMFFVYTYFCGAVYDDWIYSKAALAVFSVYYLQEFIMCRWYLDCKQIDKKTCIELAYRYAREVEHSDNNLNMLEEWLA